MNVNDTDRVDLFKLHKQNLGDGLFKTCARHVASASFLKMVYDLCALDRVSDIRSRLAENGGVFLDAGEAAFYLEHRAQRFEDEPRCLESVWNVEYIRGQGPLNV